MVKFVLHAGFPKCGSTAIFSALRHQLDALNAHGVRVFDRDFRLRAEAQNLHPPLWEMQNAMTDREAGLRARTAFEAAIAEAEPESVLLLSTENLSAPQMAKVFEGLDSLCEMELVFYFRPQVDWIPSAWKQWNLKDGVTLEETVADHIRLRRPGYLASARAWQEALPRLKVRPRPFVGEAMKNGDPAEDFFAQLGVAFDPSRRTKEGANPSADYALLHLMMRHHDRLFTGRHDNARIHALLAKLPDKYHRTNAPMLSQDQADRIAEAFHEANCTLCRDYLGMTEGDADAFVRRHFHRTVRGRAYAEMAETELLERAERETSGRPAALRVHAAAARVSFSDRIYGPQQGLVDESKMAISDRTLKSPRPAHPALCIPGSIQFSFSWISSSLSSAPDASIGCPSKTSRYPKTVSCDRTALSGQVSLLTGRRGHRHRHKCATCRYHRRAPSCKSRKPECAHRAR